MLNITSGGMSGGYRNYLMNLVPRLARHPGVQALLVAVPETIGFSKLQDATPDVQWLTLKCSLSTLGREVDRRARGEIARFKPDVIFVPTARHWSLDGIPLVNMVRNMMPMCPTYSAYPLERIRNWARFRQTRNAVRASARVIAISQFVRDYLTDSLGVPRDKVGVIYHGTELNGHTSPQKPGNIRFQESDGFVFTAGLLYPYRGLEDLIEAWHVLAATSRPPALFIAGKIGLNTAGYHQRLEELIRRKGLDDYIRFVGVLTRNEMMWCYRNCSAFVMTSRVEACPNIAMEAMVNGCLCVSTENPPMPEIFGDAARYYPAGNARVLAERIVHVSRLSSEQRQEIARRANSRASGFTWERCCDRTVEELQMAVQGLRPRADLPQ